MVRDMSDVNNPASPTPRHNTAAGVLSLFGLCAGLATMFALVVTVMDWRDESAQARWPVVSASIDRGAVTSYRRFQSDGGGTVWQLRYRLRYEIDGEERTATLSSRSASSDDEVAKLRAWAAQHRRGGRIDVRYDPSAPNRIVFASADVPNAGPRTSSNLKLTGLAAIVCFALLVLAKHMKSREALDAGTGEVSPLGRVALGFSCAAMGFIPMGIGISSAIHATHPLTSEDFISVLAGLIFVFGGVLLGLPPGRTGLQRLFGALLATAFAATVDWIAFGPGERHFGGTLSAGIAIGFHPSEFFGRAVFGIAAVPLDILAIFMWAGCIRRLLAARRVDGGSGFGDGQNT
jgi:hypothetical protein